ncbi:MAG: helix-turn-helix transcriptional regulator [Lachnospiraceae bacterium]|nr:helix-turn-helix transcriptional regulator [Lachnospiraceae bacterium]
MNDDFVRDKLARLLTEKDISYYEASLGIGHARGYIRDYISGKTKSIPLREFFIICDYLKISPSAFLDTDNASPLKTEAGYQEFKKLDPEDQEDYIRLFRRQNNRRKKEKEKS